jgi:shikimate dehydrogenase
MKELPIGEKTRLCGSIASRPNKLGPIMHNAAYRALGLDFVYMAFGVTDLKKAIEGVRGLGIRGLGVSMPFKQEVIQYLDEIDETARAIGAVNTVCNDNGKLCGYNSDWIGAVKALEEKTSIEGKRVVLVGAGGVARAIAYGIKKRAGRIVVFDRTLEKAKRLALDFGIELGGSIERVEREKDYDILINATSVGSYPNTKDSVFPKAVLRPRKAVLDVVFNPPETALIRAAKDAGCSTIPGYRMLIHQALFQFELYTGRKAPFDVMEKALLAAI